MSWPAVYSTSESLPVIFFWWSVSPTAAWMGAQVDSIAVSFSSDLVKVFTRSTLRAAARVLISGIGPLSPLT